MSSKTSILRRRISAPARGRGHMHLHAAEDICTLPRAGEFVSIPTDGLMSDLTTLTHQGQVNFRWWKDVHFAQQAGEKHPSLDQPGEWHVEKDNGNWTSGTRHRRWPRELLYKELKEEHVYNLLTDNRVIKANQMAKRISQEEREKAFKQAFTAAAGSVLQDVLNGREVDGHAAVSQSAGAGAGPLTSHTVHGVTGSSPIAGGTGACVGATSHGGRWPSSDGSGCSRSCSLRSSQRDQLRTQSWCGCWDDHRCLATLSMMWWKKR